MLAAMPGHQKTVTINNYPLYLETPFTFFPQQELDIRDYIQGGPRSQVYEMGKKIVKGSMSFILSVNANGDLDDAVQELFECAQYPLRDLTIRTNYVLGQYYITADHVNGVTMMPNVGFDVYEKMIFEDCAVTNLSLEVKEYGSVSAKADLIGTISATTASTIPALPSYNMMRRNISYAECDVYITSPTYNWDTTKTFNLSIENEIEPIYTFIKATDRSTWTDLPRAIAMGKSHVTGDITYVVDRGTAAAEQASLPSGSFIGNHLIFDISGVMLIDIPWCQANVAQQPIELGLLERKTEFLALFDSTNLSDNEGHFITFR